MSTREVFSEQELAGLRGFPEISGKELIRWPVQRGKFCALVDVPAEPAAAPARVDTELRTALGELEQVRRCEMPAMSFPTPSGTPWSGGLRGCPSHAPRCWRWPRVAGIELREEVLARVVPHGDDRPSLGELLAEAAAARVLVRPIEPPGCYRFSHDLYRETIHAGLTSALRGALHLGVGTRAGSTAGHRRGGAPGRTGRASPGLRRAGGAARRDPLFRRGRGRGHRPARL